MTHNTSRVAKVTLTELNRRGARFQYTAHHEDGTTTVIRTATREYANAFQYDRQVCSGPRGLSAFFTFGQAPGSRTAQVIGAFKVERRAQAPTS